MLITILAILCQSFLVGMYYLNDWTPRGAYGTGFEALHKVRISFPSSIAFTYAM